MRNKGRHQALISSRKQLISRVQKIRSSLSGATILKRAAELAAAMTQKQRAEVVKEVSALRTALAALEKAVEG